MDAYRGLPGPGGAFLPGRVPVIHGLAEPFCAHRDAAFDLAERYPRPGTGVRRWLDTLFAQPPPPDVLAAARDADPATKDGLLLVLTVLAHAYRWDSVPPAAARFADERVVVPAGIREPWAALCQELDVPLVGSTWSMILCNWRVEGTAEGSAYDAFALPDSDLRIGCGWLRPPTDSDLEQFSLAFVGVEAKGTRVVALTLDAVVGALHDDAEATTDALGRLADAVDGVTGQFVERIRGANVALDRWLEWVQPTFEWALPGDDGRHLAGPSGMQLGTVQTLDAALGVPVGSPTAKAMIAARAYLPSRQRELLAVLDRYAPALRRFVLSTGRQDLKRAFNDSVRALARFRVAHRVQGARYLRAGEVSGPRLSTGLEMPLRDGATTATDAAEVFEREMLERTTETIDALVPGAGERSTVRAPETCFRFLDRRQIRRLLDVAERRSLPGGSVIIAAGERSHAMYLMVEGSASVVDDSAPDSAPDSTPVARLWPGELFGELSFLGTVPSKSVIADHDVVVDVLRGNEVHATLDADPAFAAAFYRSLAVLVARRLNET